MTTDDLAHLAAVIASGFVQGNPQHMPTHATIARKSVAIALAIRDELVREAGERPRREPPQMPIPGGGVERQPKPAQTTPTSAGEPR